MRGRALGLSRPRRVVIDLMHFSAGVPTNPVQRRMRLGPIAAARSSCDARPSWQAIFLKAYAVVCGEFPPLRRAYVKFPWHQLYEYPATNAAVTVEREYRGESVPFMATITQPERRGVGELDAILRGLRQQPLEDVKCFRRALQVSAWPRPLRRLLWWVGLNVGRQRANYFGTFGLTVLSSLGTESLHPLSPLTTTLCYGVIQDDGGVDVRLSYDHRVVDGAEIARALARLEEVLNGELRAELMALRRVGKEKAHGPEPVGFVARRGGGI